MLTPYRSYESVAEKRAKAQRALSVLLESNTDVKPLVLNGSPICRCFWGKAWFAHFDLNPEFAAKMPKGRSYVRNNAVCHLDITRGLISAKVSGSSLFNVDIVVDPIPEADWSAIKEECEGLLFSHTELLNGKISKTAKDILTNPDKGIFPRPSEINAKCDCQFEGEGVCNHIAAAICGVAYRLDTQPALTFLLRGVNSWELISEPPDSLLAEKSFISELAKPLEHFTPAINITSVDSLPPVIVRRRNGKESRLMLRDSELAEALDEEVPTQEMEPETQAPKRRTYRTRASRRTKGKWVPIDVDANYPDHDTRSGEAGLFHSGAKETAAHSSNKIQQEEKHLKEQGDPGRRQDKSSLVKDKFPKNSSLGSEDNRFQEPLIGKNKSTLDVYRETESLPTDERRSKRKVHLKDTMESIWAKDAKKSTLATIRSPKRGATVASSRKAAGTAPSKTRKIMKTSTQKTLTRSYKKSDNSLTRKTSAKKGSIPELDFNKVTGKSIKSFRRYLGLSIESFALKLEMCTATVRRWEETSGRLALHYPSLKALKKLYTRELRKEAREA
ncbi:MAG: hypothetical protein LBF22_06320 [Deltaproteobacteria bacterium]|jgi:uncharacterized Zn finger protein/DNA-binding transcriptional regulator YiaG|nr:hypothetical protein [Deltaproteobacteria bacterium]